MVQIENFQQLGTAIDSKKPIFQKIGTTFYKFIADKQTFKQVEELINLKLLYV